MPLPLTPIVSLRLASLLRSLFVTLGSLSLFMGFRAALLRGGLFRSWSLNVLASAPLRLRVTAGRSALLLRR